MSTNFQSLNLRLTRFTRAQIEYEIAPELPDVSHQLTITYTDASGRRHVAVEQAYGAISGASISFGPPIPDSIKSADLTFAFSTNLYTEFLACPGPAPAKGATTK